VDVSCKGKFIYFKFEGGWTIWNTLGMAGSWSFKRKKHSRVMFKFNESSIFFTDIRNFGTLKFIKGYENLQKKLDSLGPDMLSDEPTNLEFISAIRKKSNKTITEALMNQSVVSGVGNYLKSESLYLSKISPHRVVKTLSDEELSQLNQSVKATILSSYLSGGATIHTFEGFNGEFGEYSRRFAVYNQKTDPNGLKVVREKTQDGRTTFWVKEIQK
jgi:DNA-formamidopyrimidine glycosylase